MNTKEKIWELLQVKVMKRKYSDQQIAKMVGVTRQYVHRLRKMYKSESR